MAGLCAGVIATTPVLLAGAAGLTKPPSPWTAATRRRTRNAVLIVVAMSWVFQLRRSGFVSFTAPKPPIERPATDPYAVPTASPNANWGQRVGAYLIDVALIVVLEIIFVRLVFALFIVILLASLGWTIYNRWYQGGTTGQSLGKKVPYIRLVSEETGQPIGPLMAFMRDICHVVDGVICYIGFLFPLWDTNRQTLADKIVRTVVIVDGNG